MTPRVVATITCVEVGIRDLRADLSRWIKRVREGEELVVTDRGEPVARIVPANGRSRFDELVAAGVIKLAPRRKAPPPRPIEGIEPLSDLLQDERR